MLGALVLFLQHKHLRTHHPIQWHQVMYRPIYRLWHQTLTQMFFFVHVKKKKTFSFLVLRVLLPVVPHKAAAEVSKIERYRRGELL